MNKFKYLLAVILSASAVTASPAVKLEFSSNSSVVLKSLGGGQKVIDSEFGKITFLPLPILSGSDTKTMISRRKTLFLDLFNDDVNPYTGLKVKKSDCLLKTETNIVIFYGGPGRQWADCHLNKKSQLAARIWTVCKGSLFEVNAPLKKDLKLPKLTCLDTE